MITSNWKKKATTNVLVKIVEWFINEMLGIETYMKNYLKMI